MNEGQAHFEEQGGRTILFRLKQNRIPAGISQTLMLNAIGPFFGTAPAISIVIGNPDPHILVFFTSATKPGNHKAPVGLANG